MLERSHQPREIAPVPEETQRVARTAFPKGNVYVRLHDEIGTIFDDPALIIVPAITLRSAEIRGLIFYVNQNFMKNRVRFPTHAWPDL